MYNVSTFCGRCSLSLSTAACQVWYTAIVYVTVLLGGTRLVCVNYVKVERGRGRETETDKEGERERVRQVDLL